MNAMDERIIEQLQMKVDALRGKACSVCAGELCGHEKSFHSDNMACVACDCRGFLG